MIRSCAWCGKEFGSKSPHGDSEVTHGMCTACLDQFLATLKPTELPGDGKEGDSTLPAKKEEG